MKLTVERIRQVEADLSNGYHPVAALTNRGLTFAGEIGEFIKFCDANNHEATAEKLRNMNWRKYAPMLD